MRVGAFEVEDLNEYPREPVAISVLWPWIDVNSVGSLVLREIRDRFSASFFAKLRNPGTFYDFTRYRPIIDLEEGIKDLRIPNSTVFYARREKSPDILLLRMREPHSNGEYFVSSVVKLLKRFDVRTYILVGSMYDAVPHTKPLLVSGYGMGEKAREILNELKVLPITYRGPSSIVNLVAKRLSEDGVDILVFIVSIPHYVILDEDYAGKLRLIELLGRIIDIPVDEADYLKVLEQKNMILDLVERSPELKSAIPQLEKLYEARIKVIEKEGAYELSPEMEELLWKTLGKDVGRA